LSTFYLRNHGLLDKPRTRVKKHLADVSRETSGLRFPPKASNCEISRRSNSGDYSSPITCFY
jgi:hypothetical protein